MLGGSGGSCDDEVRRVDELTSLHGVGDILRQVDRSDFLCAEEGKTSDDFGDLVCEFAGRYEDEG